jgi:large conductance mechanosensitive channel
VAVIIGAAIGKVVSSVVADLLMPVIGLFVGGGEWRTLQIPLRTAPDGKVLSALAVGNFLGSVVDFVIIAFFVYLVTKSLLKEAPAPPGPAMKLCGACGESILAKATRCRYCTSAV